MWKKRLSLLMVMTLVLSLLTFATGCSTKETAQPAPTPAPVVQKAAEVNEEEILTNAAIDYFNYLQGNGLVDAVAMNEKLSAYTVIDIRGAEDFAKGHIEGATNVLMAKMGEKIPELDKSKTYVIVCYSGQTASQTMGVLKMAGFDAFALKGGFPSWEKAGLPVVQ